MIAWAGGPSARHPGPCPGEAPPNAIASEDLVEGHGATVRANDLGVANHLGQAWDGPVSDSSSARGAVLVLVPAPDGVPAVASGVDVLAQT